MKGSLTVIAGCMSSGKSTELMRLLRRAEIAKRSVRVYIPKLDTRSGDTVASRDGLKRPAFAVDFADILDIETRDRNDVVGIDEIQLFGAPSTAVVESLVNLGRNVIVSGLDTDFRGEPFGPMPDLLALADSVTKLDAICVVCGSRATRSQRLIGGLPAPYDAPLIQIGGDESYQARCRNCHIVPRG